MDDTTKELAEQVGFGTSAWGNLCVRHSNGSYVVVEDELEQFAELIRLDERNRLKKKGRLKMEFPRGCGKKLHLDEDYTVGCGDNDMGSSPWLCDECKKNCD